jgi:hypothetical protein
LRFAPHDSIIMEWQRSTPLTFDLSWNRLMVLHGKADRILELPEDDEEEEEADG